MRPVARTDVLPRGRSGNLGTFDDEIREIDIVTGLGRLLALPLGSLFRFQLLALAFGLLALTFDD